MTWSGIAHTPTKSADAHDCADCDALLSASSWQTLHGRICLILLLASTSRYDNSRGYDGIVMHHDAARKIRSAVLLSGRPRILILACDNCIAWIFARMADMPLT
jgi:hypothetical protein